MPRRLEITSAAGNAAHCLTEHGIYSEPGHIDLGSIGGRERVRIVGTLGGASVQLGTVARDPSDGSLAFTAFVDASAGPHAAPVEIEIACGGGVWLGAEITGAGGGSDFKVITAPLT